MHGKGLFHLYEKQQQYSPNNIRILELMFLCIYISNGWRTRILKNDNYPLFLQFTIRVSACSVGELVGRHCCSIEMDCSALDERKESGNDSLFHLHQLSQAASTEIPMQINHGQLMI